VPSLDNWQNYPIGSPTSQFYANSPYDVRHRLSVGASFELPGIQLSNSFERRALGGWTVADISILQTGTPFSVFNGGAFQAQLINPNLPARRPVTCASPRAAETTTRTAIITITPASPPTNKATNGVTTAPVVVSSAPAPVLSFPAETSSCPRSAPWATSAPISSAIPATPTTISPQEGHRH